MAPILHREAHVSTSTREGLTLGLPAAAADVLGLPVSASTWGSIVNNVNHVADESSRVLVAFAQDSTTANGLTMATASAWTRIMSCGPFPLLVGADGQPYPVRVRVGGRSDLGATCYLRVGVCPVGQAEDLMTAATVSAAVLESTSFSSATNAWRVGGVVYCPLEWSSLSVVNAVASGALGDVAAVLATVEVWGYSAANDVHVTQVYAAEQVAL